MTTISANIKKLDIPTIFLDTSVILHTAKVKMKEVNDKRYDDLYSKIFQLTRIQKVLCPNAHQGEEFLRTDRSNNISYEIIHSLSMGFEFLSPLEIQKAQHDVYIDAYTQKRNSVFIDSKKFVL